MGFLIPALLVYGAFSLWPLVQGIGLSFTDSRGGRTASFVGLEQYQKAMSDPVVQLALVNTIVYAAGVVIAINVLAILLARALYMRPRIRRVGTLLILTPSLVSPVMAGFIFAYVFAPDGALNVLLGTVGLSSLERPWLGDPSTALAAVASVNIWMFVGYNSIIFLAGFLSMPADLLEAAELDGAGGWRRFRSVEWPLLAPSVTVAATLSIIGALKVFEFPLVLTKGGPANATQTLSLQVFERVFGAGGTFAYGIAISVILLVLVVLTAAIGNAVAARREANI